MLQGQSQLFCQPCGDEVFGGFFIKSAKKNMKQTKCSLQRKRCMSGRQQVENRTLCWAISAHNFIKWIEISTVKLCLSWEFVGTILIFRISISNFVPCCLSKNKSVFSRIMLYELFSYLTLLKLKVQDLVRWKCFPWKAISLLLFLCFSVLFLLSPSGISLVSC